MSMIGEQIKELRELANDVWLNTNEKFGIKINKAADTIEALSEKASVENMERSERYYEIRKELVEQHNKAFELINKMPLEGNEVWHGYVGGVMQTLGFLIDCMDNRP